MPNSQRFRTSGNLFAAGGFADSFAINTDKPPEKAIYVNFWKVREPTIFGAGTSLHGDSA
jgi:hypothetical protein